MSFRKCDPSSSIIIIKSPLASRRIRLTHILRPTLSVLRRCLGYIPTLPPYLVSLSLNSSSPSALWSPSRSLSFWSPPQCCKTVVSLSLLSTCPNQFHLLRRTSQLISLIPAISTTLLFVILCCHVIFIIRLRHWHWKLFSFRSSAFVIFHVSQPYSRTGRIKVLNRRILVLLPIPLTAHTFPNL